MIRPWLWFWIAGVLLVLTPTLGYGWGYRGWGAPYPSYVQRRRGAAALANGSAGFDHRAWGWLGDVVWLILLLCAAWVVAMLVFR